MSTIRQEQIQKRLVQEISGMLHKELKDPRLGFVTVTGAEISRDLRHAKVFVSVMGDDDEQQASLTALRRVTGYIRGEFARRAHLRIAPELDFRPDTGIAHGARIFELLKQIEQEQPAVVAPEEPKKSDG
jgi:ribosome-binding factor A